MSDRTPTIQQQRDADFAKYQQLKTQIGKLDVMISELCHSREKMREQLLAIINRHGFRS